MRLRPAPSGPHTNAVVAALQAAHIAVDRGKKPDDAGWQGEPGQSDFVPYVVLFPTPGTPDGENAEPYEYLNYEAQLTCIGVTQAQAETLFDAVIGALVGRRLTVAGRSTYLVQLELARPVTTDNQVVPAEHYGVVQISVRSQPA